MRRSSLLRGLATLAVLVALLAGAAVWRVRAVTRPAPVAAAGIDFDAMHLPLEEVRFPASDGISLSGWWIPGAPDAGTLVLCHDRGARKDRLINLAIDLHRDGFSVLLFDFRGHGDSDAAASTFGLHERRDVLGAVDEAERRSNGSAPVGVYGVGMGAQAAVLAAGDRPSVRVLVLDRLDPEPQHALTRAFFAGWEFAGDDLEFVPRRIFSWMHGADEKQTASARIERLPGRSMLLLAPANDPSLAEAMRDLVARVPDTVDADGNLVVLPGTQGNGLYGEHAERYHRRVAGFFRERLRG